MIVAVPKPAAGCIVIGQQSISYHRTNSEYVAITPHALGQSTVQCCTMIDPTGDRFLLADMSGRLFLLLLERVPTSGTAAGTSDSASAEEESPVSTLRLELLGEATIAEDIAYVGDGVFYIGSRMGDSQLIKLVSEESMEQSNSTAPAFVQQLNSFANIGPILDMVLIDNDAQTYMITASNAFKEGSLRIIRNGIGIQELASTELPAVKGIWSVAFGMDATDETGEHNMLVVAFLERTALLRLDGAEMEAIELQCLPSNEQALLACNMRTQQKNCLLVVTPTHVRLLDASTGGGGTLLDEYTCEEAKVIALCAANEKANQLVVCSGRQITYMCIDSGSAKIEVQRTATLEHEIACVDMALLEPNAPSTLCCVGLWQDMSVRVLTLPDLEGIHTETIGGDVLIRSVMLARFEAQTYLLCALGDGQVYYFQYEKDSECSFMTFSSICPAFRRSTGSQEGHTRHAAGAVATLWRACVRVQRSTDDHLFTQPEARFRQCEREARGAYVRTRFGRLPTCACHLRREYNDDWASGRNSEDAHTHCAIGRGPPTYRLSSGDELIGSSHLAH